MSVRVVISLALVAVLAVPAVFAIKCYQCADLEALTQLSSDSSSSSGLSSLLGSSLAKAAMPPCKEFDTMNPQSRFATECPKGLGVAGMTPGCMKTKLGEVTMRACQAVIPETGCQENGEASICYCDDDLCNGAGLTSPVLFLMVPAVLLALLRA